MDPQDYSKEKKMKNQEQLSESIDDNQLNINSLLNNDCLIQIFGYLTIKEKLQAEGVCRKWNQLAKESWSHVTSLNFIDALPFKESVDGYKKNVNTFFLSNILERCSSYLNNISICHKVKSLTDFSQVLDKIPIFCKNISSLSLQDQCFQQVVYSDEDLKVFLNCSSKLSKIDLKELHIKCNNLFNDINANNIKQIDVQHCDFDSNDHLYDFLSKLKNLEEFSLNYNGDETVISSIIDAITKSECKNILSVTIFLDNEAEVPNLSLLLSKQNKLQELHFYHVYIDENYITEKSTECIEKLTLFDCDFESNKLRLKFFNCLKNLQTLRFSFYRFGNNHLRAITSCLNIKILEIGFYECNVSDDLGCYLSKLKNLESLSIDSIDKTLLIDNLLEDLSECLNLRDLTLKQCHLSKYVVLTITSLLNLNSLYLKGCKNISDKSCSDIIKKLLHLKKLKLSSSSVTSKLIDLAGNIKNDRGDKQVLNIIIKKYGSKIKQNNLENVSPLLKITFAD